MKDGPGDHDVGFYGPAGTSIKVGYQGNLLVSGNTAAGFPATRSSTGPWTRELARLSSRLLPRLLTATVGIPGFLRRVILVNNRFVPRFQFDVAEWFDKSPR